MDSDANQDFGLVRSHEYWSIIFAAMASPCEILVRRGERSEVERLASLAVSETRRIEQKFSRYRQDNIVHEINHSEGSTIELDEESARLLAYASECFQLSDGLFDVTSGVLRKAWKFDGQEVKPDRKQIKFILEKVGWEKVKLCKRSITMPPGMQLDLGGLGKEYAVDRVFELLRNTSNSAIMVNFGGDLRASGGDEEHMPWKVGIEDPDKPNDSIRRFELMQGSVATSGDSQRFCYYKGKRLGHILNPRTGWPVVDMPRSITVLAEFCTSAGFLATLAMLKGPGAESFLQDQGVEFHCLR